MSRDIGSQLRTIKTTIMNKNDEMVKIWFDDMEEMFQIKLSEWEQLKDNTLPPYNNYSEHHFALGSNDFEWFENSNLEYMNHRIKVWRKGYGSVMLKRNSL